MTDELSVVWLDPSVVPFSVVSLSDVVGGDTVVVVGVGLGRGRWNSPWIP